MSRIIQINQETKDILSMGIFDGNIFKLTQQLSRAEYENVNKVLTALGAKWNRKAGGHIFEYDIRKELAEAINSGLVQDWKKETNFFYTPRLIVEKMLQYLLYSKSDNFTLLEPSAGQGHILDIVKEYFPSAVLKSVEINPNHCNILREKGYDTICEDFLNIKPFPVDVVLMNPPFDYETEHIKHAYEFLNLGGILISITSEGLWFRMSKKDTEFRDWVNNYYSINEKLPQNAFKESGTGVATRILMIEKEI